MINWLKKYLIKDEAIALEHESAYRASQMKKYYHHAGYSPMMTTPDHMYNVFDRTRAMIDIPQMECLTPIGNLVEPKTVSELCYASAQNILKSLTRVSKVA